MKEIKKPEKKVLDDNFPCDVLNELLSYNKAIDECMAWHKAEMKKVLEEFANKPNASQLGFKTRKMPQMKDGVSTWPAKYTIEAIEKEKQAFREMGKLDIWLRERMCEAVSPETRIFNPHDYRYFTARSVDKIIEKTNRFATLDPASSPDIASCYCAIVVNAVNEDNYWNIVDIPFGRWDSAELIDKMFDTVVKWNLRDFGIEKGMFKQVIEPFIYKEMSKRNIFFNIIPIEHAKVGSVIKKN